jgi:hypothetical protein
MFISYRTLHSAVTGFSSFERHTIGWLVVYRVSHEMYQNRTFIWDLLRDIRGDRDGVGIFAWPVGPVERGGIVAINAWSTRAAIASLALLSVSGILSAPQY